MASNLLNVKKVEALNGMDAWKNKDRTPPKALALEAHQGTESFASYAKSHGRDMPGPTQSPCTVRHGN